MRLLLNADEIFLWRERVAEEIARPGETIVLTITLDKKDAQRFLDNSRDNTPATLVFPNGGV